MNKITVTIAEDSALLEPANLAEFLFLFRAVNVALDQVAPNAIRRDSREPSEEEVKEFRSSISGYSPQELDSLFQTAKSPGVIEIDQIVRQSPLEIVFGGCAFLLVLAVIFSGGSVSVTLRGVRANLPSLGKGIKSLREALGLDGPIKAGFGIRPKTIKLSKTEFESLMLQDPKSKNKGGFQHFLVGLQDRVNKQTRELVLSESDLERIYRYKANPQKGGWQSRFKKIFDRHFSDDPLGGELNI